jgi:sigma-B regulation protein RsbU (phosphoserine phosphatase)
MSETLKGQLGGQFVTAACLHIDSTRSSATFSGAGHPPIVHWRAAERRIVTVPSEGMLMGVVPSTYPSTRLTLAPHDRLVLYTDGVLEAANSAGAFFGDGRFHQIVAGHAHGSGADLARAIVDDMKRWIAPQEGFADDVTIVVVEVT